MWISPTGHRYPIEPAQVGTILTAISSGTYRSTPEEPPRADEIDLDALDFDELDVDELVDAELVEAELVEA